MDLENKVLIRQENTLSADDNYQELPPEFRAQIKRYMRRRTDLSDRLFSVATVFFGAIVFLPFLTKPFSTGSFALKANSLERPEALGFVTFLGDVEDLSDSKMKDMFGWGGLDLIYRASQALAPHLQNCRAQLQSANISAGFTFRFDIKVDVKKPGFNVTGLLDGQDTEPDVATCLRDKINALQISDFAKLRAAQPKTYKLRLGVQLAHGADGGAP